MKKSTLDKIKTREKILSLRASYDIKTLNTFSWNAQLNLEEFLKKKNFKILDFLYHSIMRFPLIFCFLNQKKKLFPKYFAES